MGRRALTARWVQIPMPEGLAADIALEVLRAPLEEELPREAPPATKSLRAPERWRLAAWRPARRDGNAERCAHAWGACSSWASPLYRAGRGRSRASRTAFRARMTARRATRTTARAAETRHAPTRSARHSLGAALDGAPSWPRWTRTGTGSRTATSWPIHRENGSAPLSCFVRVRSGRRERAARDATPHSRPGGREPAPPVRGRGSARSTSSPVARAAEPEPRPAPTAIQLVPLHVEGAKASRAPERERLTTSITRAALRPARSTEGTERHLRSPHLRARADRRRRSRRCAPFRRAWACGLR